MSSVRQVPGTASELVFGLCTVILTQGQITCTASVPVMLQAQLYML